MSSTSKLEWWVDEREYNHFREFVNEKHGVISLCFPSEVLQAMRAFIDKDRAASVEDELTALDDVLTDVLTGYSRRRTSCDPLAKDELGGEDTVKIRCEVPTRLKEEFSIYVDENSEWGYGEALGRAMNAHRDGGREQRLTAAISDMMEAAEASASGAESGTDTESRPYSKSDKIAAIRRDLAAANGMDTAEEIEQLPRQQVVRYIHDYCSRTPEKDASDRTVSTYLDHIKDELGLVEHPKNDVLLIKDDGSAGPAFVHKGYDALTTAERVEAVRVKLLQKANSGRGAQVSAAAIQTEFFDSEPSDGVAHNLRDGAAEADGFAVRRAHDGVKKVRVEIPEVTDERLLDAAGLLEQQAAEADTEAEMDALMNAQVVMDGGSDTHGGSE